MNSLTIKCSILINLTVLGIEMYFWKAHSSLLPLNFFNIFFLLKVIIKILSQFLHRLKTCSEI